MANSQSSDSRKVFVSHASEDKDRFVRDFGKALLAEGIDVWVDEWEILPGDSLVDKIFEEGLKDAETVIVVVSEKSIVKPWVREELNVSVVKKINDKCKLIPVVIDNCEVPEALKSTVWVKIPDVNSYDAELSRIVRAIYGQYEKPTLGTPPVYVQTAVDVVPGLTVVDSLVLKLACEKAVEKGEVFMGVEEIAKGADLLGIEPEALDETLRILNDRGYVKGNGFLVSDGPNIAYFTITPAGFEIYAKNYVENYDEIYRSVAFHIVNTETVDSESMANSLNRPRRIVEHILEMLRDRGILKVAPSRGGPMIVLTVSPELKRML